MELACTAFEESSLFAACFVLLLLFLVYLFKRGACFEPNKAVIVGDIRWLFLTRGALYMHGYSWVSIERRKCVLLRGTRLLRSGRCPRSTLNHIPTGMITYWNKLKVFLCWAGRREIDTGGNVSSL